jgi:spermidine synthase
VTNVAYFLRHQGGACIIGVGAGRDVQSAILFGQKNVLGIELNPIFINLLEKQFRDFAGIAGREGVRLVVDDARSYLSTSEEKFAVIQMSMIDTWAATGAGAFSLSENALYTEEAWDVFFRRLSDDGIFTVSRWHNPDDLGETGRVVSLAVASLLRMGITSPEKHLAMVTTSKRHRCAQGRFLFFAGGSHIRSGCSSEESRPPADARGHDDGGVAAGRCRESL